jgi:hypothetical protein
MWGEHQLCQGHKCDQHQDAGEGHVDTHRAVYAEARSLGERLGQAIYCHEGPYGNQYPNEPGGPLFARYVIHQQEEKHRLKHITQVCEAPVWVHRRHRRQDRGQEEGGHGSQQREVQRTVVHGAHQLVQPCHQGYENGRLRRRNGNHRGDQEGHDGAIDEAIEGPCRRLQGHGE